MKASKLLSSEQRQQVEQAIAEAEKATSAEIVVVLATRSGRYDRPEDFVGLLLGLAAVAIAWAIWQDFGPDTRDWMTGHTYALGLFPILALFAVWAVVGAVLATVFPGIARPFIPRKQIEAEVRRRGFEAFHLFRVGHTRGRNGVLIYVSIFERTAWAVGDEAVAAALPAEHWGTVSRAIAQSFRRDDPASGLIDAVRLSGQELAAKFPLQADDADELPNQIRVLD